MESVGGAVDAGGKTYVGVDLVLRGPCRLEALEGRAVSDARRGEALVQALDIDGFGARGRPGASPLHDGCGMGCRGAEGGFGVEDPLPVRRANGDLLCVNGRMT